MKDRQAMLLKIGSKTFNTDHIVYVDLEYQEEGFSGCKIITSESDSGHKFKDGTEEAEAVRWHYTPKDTTNSNVSDLIALHKQAISPSSML